MILYHGASVGGLNELQPHLSEHGKPYVYFSENPVVAAFDIRFPEIRKKQ